MCQWLAVIDLKLFNIDGDCSDTNIIRSYLTEIFIPANICSQLTSIGNIHQPDMQCLNDRWENCTFKFGLLFVIVAL